MEAPLDRQGRRPTGVEVPIERGVPLTQGPPLRVAMVAPPWFEVPPAAYGGTELVVANLVDELVRRGHDITLIASGRHLTSASRFVQVFRDPPTTHLGEPLPEVVNAATAAAILDDGELDVDVVHDHTLAGPLLARGRETPTVVTMHGPVTGPDAVYYEHLGQSAGLVAISGAQRRTNCRLHWVGTVHNAVDVPSFPFRDHKDEYVAWIGRFAPDKAPHLAIDAARQAGRRIVLAGKLNEPCERAYFDREIAPRLGSDVDFVGEADGDLKREILAGARSFVFPIQWDEPFGMVMIEAMACGTPVVATRRGSVEEVVADGGTGIVVDDVRDLAAGISAAEEIDPHQCRSHVERHFDLPVMAAAYERLYRRAVAERRPASLRVRRPEVRTSVVHRAAPSA